MKRIGLLIVLFIAFSAINGYGGGKKELSGLTKRVDGIERNVKTIQSDKALENRIKKLEDELAQKDPPAPDGQTETAPDDGPQVIPITWAIVIEQRENLGDLNYYLSRDISLTIPGLVKNSRRVQDGVLEEIVDERRSEEKLEISKSDPGKMLKFATMPTDRESLEIFFPTQSAILVFTRDKNKNRFELTSVRKDGREFVFRGEATQLCIKYKGSSPDSITGGTETGGLASAQTAQQYREPVQPPRGNSPPAIPRNVLLENGQGYLTQDAVVDFMQKYSKSSWFGRSDISALVRAYFELAREEQVNHEIAIAQMWYATRELSYDALLRNYNYVGLEAGESGRFNDRDTGVRAHIQHLKGYASTVRPRNIVDPRYEILVTNGYLGKGSTLERLSALWSPNREYEANIIRILNSLYQYQHDSR